MFPQLHKLKLTAGTCQLAHDTSIGPFAGKPSHRDVKIPVDATSFVMQSTDLPADGREARAKALAPALRILCAMFSRLLLDRPVRPQMRLLTLTDAFIGDTGLESLADAFARGAFGLVSDLDLACNRYGDAGCTALANALNSGALGSLETLCMDDGPDGTEHPKLRAACDERCIALLGLDFG